MRSHPSRKTTRPDDDRVKVADDPLTIASRPHSADRATPRRASRRIGPRLARWRSVATDFGTIDTLGSALTYHRERHTVLAGNVANLDTPGYRPMDLERHGEGAGDWVTTFDDGGNLPSPDGNAVSLERELAKIDANRTRYAATSELVTRRFAMLRYAAGDGT
nr:flagellar basal body protein [Kofleriaceae bacterium]